MIAKVFSNNWFLIIPYHPISFSFIDTNLNHAITSHIFHIYHIIPYILIVSIPSHPIYPIYFIHPLKWFHIIQYNPISFSFIDTVLYQVITSHIFYIMYHIIPNPILSHLSHLFHPSLPLLHFQAPFSQAWRRTKTRLLTGPPPAAAEACCTTSLSEGALPVESKPKPHRVSPSRHLPTRFQFLFSLL